MATAPSPTARPSTSSEARATPVATPPPSAGRLPSCSRQTATTFADIAPTSGGAAYRYFSGGASGTDSCVIVGCTADSINVPVFGDVAVTVNDAGNILANQVVYVFDINQQYLNRQGQTGGAGEPVSFNLPAGSYLFASDFAGSRYFSAQCDVTACTAALIASSIDADLSIAKSVDRAFAAINDGVVFTLVAGNAGPMGATGVAVTDQLPAGLTYSSDDGNGAYDANTGVWTIGSLAANATATLNITAIVDAAAEGQSLTNSAQISGASTTTTPRTTPPQPRLRWV
ncbi:MAG: DUF11 domain-containing protein [Caldilineaceae bacterium]